MSNTDVLNQFQLGQTWKNAGTEILLKSTCLKNVSRDPAVRHDAPIEGVHLNYYMLNDFNSDYKSRLIELNILLLSYWFEFLDLSFLIKSMKVSADNFSYF